MDKFLLEKDGQIDFYNRFLMRVNPALSLDDILADNNDGVLNGNLLEFKLHISDLNAVLFQSIKYLSALRIKGKPIPAGIHLVDLNAGIVYYFESEPYLQDIEKVYIGGASRDNVGFIGGAVVETYHYETDVIEAEKLIARLKEKRYTKINIDENCIVGWATEYYRIVPTARKEDFLGDDTGKHKTIGEIRRPHIFADYIYPYNGETNVKFNYLMDRLNDTLQKKNLGAFYTHVLYAKKSAELVREAIKRVPDGNDYIILDRCAGTGNLESALNDEELSHCIVSTIEYYEYKVLQELYGAKVRHIIPPVETSDTFNAGLVTGADALSEEYINNPIIREYIDDEHCTVILFENPPYVETTSAEHQRNKQAKKSSTWKNSYVVQEMKKEVGGTVSNDLGNAFIWSAFKYYLRKDTDSYIVYSPVKYWKAQHLVNKRFIDGYAYNRKHFHTNTEACIMVALWSNEDDMECKELSLKAYNIIDDEIVECGNLPVKRIYKSYSKEYYDKRSIPDEKRVGILCGLNGLEKVGGKQRNKPATSEDILGYMVAHSSGFDNPDLDSSLLVGARYDGNGFFLRKDNYLEKLPMFCASRYITYNRKWTERARIMKSADGSERYKKSVAENQLDQFLLKCLLFTVLETQNHMRSFLGSDGKWYKNELCLDGSNGDTLALRDVKKLKTNDKEKIILKQWDVVLAEAKKTKEYNPLVTYGVYQIAVEIDTSYKDETTGNTVYNNVELHTALVGLKNLVKDYYNQEIVPTLFEYEFLK